MKTNLTIRLKNILDGLTGCTQNIRAWVKRRTEKDAPVIFLILVLAVILRVPFLSHPDRTVFDEVVYANFATYIVHEAPFFDIHPPLARMLFAEVARRGETFSGEVLRVETGQPFGNFPYVALRSFVALFGVLLPLLIYSAGRLLGYAPRVAMIPALFVIFDNALTVYSRVILPDMLLLVFGFSGLIAAFAATKKRAVWQRLALTILAGSLIGLAVSVKWTALGIFGIVALCFLLSRMYWEVVLSALFVALVYVSVFCAFVLYFPQGGKMDPILPPYDVPLVTTLKFPREHSPQAIGIFLLRYHGVMLETNRDPGITSEVMSAPGSLAWSVAKSSILFWEDSASGGNNGGRAITLTGNSLLWFVVFFALLFELTWIFFHIVRERRWPIDNNESILLAGYVMNYLPFFFIHRSMYLYHYFTALIFLFLIVPRITPRIIDCIARLSHDRLLAETLLLFIGFLILLNFFLLSPVTYGF